MIDEHDPPEEVPHADTELRDRLQAAGCTGPAWEMAAKERFSSWCECVGRQGI